MVVDGVLTGCRVDVVLDPESLDSTRSNQALTEHRVGLKEPLEATLELEMEVDEEPEEKAEDELLPELTEEPE